VQPQEAVFRAVTLGVEAHKVAVVCLAALCLLQCIEERVDTLSEKYAQRLQESKA
jgi:hypothetical protein